ncbi:hypothetical protein Cni_G23879 [Canna indica]|uniref:Anthocyanin acyltransferase n=1 Tax=Canna indica TaxID=4628 RepID=A0AAQ3KY09_9LILI|nr:hypothetical protein Cni_G23879 [Canna indica]
MSRVVVKTTYVPLPPSPAPLPDRVDLSLFDALWICFPPIQRLLLFRGSHVPPLPALLDSLRSALSRTLLHYFTLAGKLTYAPASGDVFINCSPVSPSSRRSPRAATSAASPTTRSTTSTPSSNSSRNSTRRSSPRQSSPCRLPDSAGPRDQQIRGWRWGSPRTTAWWTTGRCGGSWRRGRRSAAGRPGRLHRRWIGP